MQDSHTTTRQGDKPDQPSPLRLADAAALGLPERLAGRLDGHLAAFVAHMTQGLLAASTAVGLEVMRELMDAEVAGLAGPRGTHDPARTATAKRHGTEPGTVTLGGRRIPVRRPRVRTVGDGEQEVALEAYQEFVATDLLAEGSSPGCWRGCRPAATQRGWSRSARRSTSKPVAPRSRRCRAGLSPPPPSGSASCWAAGWMTAAGWWCSWTGLGWASICWSARWA